MCLLTDVLMWVRKPLSLGKETHGGDPWLELPLPDVIADGPVSKEAGVWRFPSFCVQTQSGPVPPPAPLGTQAELNRLSYLRKLGAATGKAP